jgi:hypothetical protein
MRQRRSTGGHNGPQRQAHQRRRLSHGGPFGVLGIGREIVPKDQPRPEIGGHDDRRREAIRKQNGPNLHWVDRGFGPRQSDTGLPRYIPLLPVARLRWRR